MKRLYRFSTASPSPICHWTFYRVSYTVLELFSLFPGFLTCTGRFSLLRNEPNWTFDFKTNSSLTESPSTLGSWKVNTSSSPSGPIQCRSGWIASSCWPLQPLPSAQPLSRSVCNFPILPQFPLKSAAIAFPHPRGPAVRRTVLQRHVPWANPSTFTGPITTSTHTRADALDHRRTHAVTGFILQRGRQTADFCFISPNKLISVVILLVSCIVIVKDDNESKKEERLCFQVF